MGVIEIPYAPRALQSEIYARMRRFNVLVCHRRFGKTVLEVNKLIREACTNSLPNPRYAYIAPLYRQAKAVAWDYFRHFAGVIPGVVFNEAELRCDLPNGARITLYGADNPDSLRGIYLDGVVLDEYAQMYPRAWTEVIRPAIADRRGWADFIGTPMGHNAFYEMYQHALMQMEEHGDGSDWFTKIYKASETGILDDDEIKAMRSQMSDEEYEQELECSFEAAIRGAYFGQAMGLANEEKRIARVPYQAEIRVETAWDLGVGDYTTIWFYQMVGKEIHVIDYYENSGEGLHHYAGVLDKKGYLYGSHWAPHDIKVREWGNQGKTRAEEAMSLGIVFRIVPRMKLEDKINAARVILRRCWFDRERCKEGIEALMQYRKEWDDMRQVFRDRPLHDWASHGADGFCVLAQAVRPDIVDTKLTDNVLTFNELLKNKRRRTRNNLNQRI